MTQYTPLLEQDALTKRSYMPTLDGLRGLACLLVVFAHTAEVAQTSLPYTAAIGALGVLIFFALSGFLMGTLYLVGKPFTADSANKYVAARFARIVPAYMIAVLFYLVLTQTIPGYHQVDLVQAIRLLLLSGSAAVFWSIPPEVQFYGFFFFLWYALTHTTLQARLLAGALAVITLGAGATNTDWPGILLLSKLHIFLYGVVVAVLAAHPKNKIMALPLVQIGLIAGAVLYFYGPLDKSNAFADLVFTGLIALCVGALSHQTFLTRILATAPMRFLGHASFSIYLFHGPVLRITDLMIAPLHDQDLPILFLIALIALLLPSLFHLVIEKRLNKITRSFLTNHLNKPITFFLTCTKMAPAPNPRG